MAIGNQRARIILGLTLLIGAGNSSAGLWNLQSLNSDSSDTFMHIISVMHLGSDMENFGDFGAMQAICGGYGINI